MNLRFLLEIDMAEKKESFFNKMLGAAKKYVLFGTAAVSSMGFTVKEASEKEDSFDNSETKDLVINRKSHFSSDEMIQELINENTSKSIQYSYKEYLNIKGPNRKKTLNSRDYGGKAYCLRTHTLAEEKCNHDMNLDYKDYFWKVANKNKAGCPEFMEYVGYAFPEHMKAKLGKRNDRLKKVAYSPMKINIEDTKVGDLVFITVTKRTNQHGDRTGSGWHAMKVMGHEYDLDGKMVGCVFLTVNGKHEGFRVLGEKGVYSTVPISEYENSDIKFCKNLTGVIVNMSGIDKECLDMKISSSINDNMSDDEKLAKRAEIIDKYIGNDSAENLSLKDVYNKSGKEVVEFFNENKEYYAFNDFEYVNSVKEKLDNKTSHEKPSNVQYASNITMSNKIQSEEKQEDVFDRLRNRKETEQSLGYQRKSRNR